jgi:MFS superfamily sulfate permease-like transporter
VGESGAKVGTRAWAPLPPRGVRKYLPTLTWLPSYDRSWLRLDVIAGATIWGLLETIAYAGLAGLPPQAGLYTVLATLAAYAIFGTSRHLVASVVSIKDDWATVFADA